MLTLTRGFAAASVVLFAAKLGPPISATHMLVGAVMGVGFARGLNNVRAETVKKIVASWLVTIPIGGTLAVIYTWVFNKLSSFVFGYYQNYQHSSHDEPNSADTSRDVFTIRVSMILRNILLLLTRSSRSMRFCYTAP
ncbi:hypothetical protein HA466_0320850 [Hirschfeldia incana]|nr:hypothetical protein HA466_0320850 [Hirschfeldia incana]